MIYRSTQGDILDAICTQHYGASAFDLGRIYAANPGLARLGPVLPSGIKITLPDSARIPQKPTMISLID